MAHKANENCLENMRCPNCGNMDRLQVVGTARFDVTDDGVDFAENDMDIEYGNDAPTRCPDCKFEGTWKDFDNRNLRND